MSVSNINSGVHAGGHASPQKVCDENERKNKERKKRRPRKNFLIRNRKDFVWLLQKLDMTDVDELQVNNSSHTKGTSYLSSKGTKGMVFVRGHMNWCHTTRNGWYLGLVAPISSIVRLLILYS